MDSKDLFSQLRFDGNGLIPAVVQDARTRQILTLAYMNKESLDKTIRTGETWFWSRSRRELWHKGATSGNTQEVERIAVDCDRDALLVEVNPRGPACHTGTESCFFTGLQGVVTPKDASVEAPAGDRRTELGPVLTQLSQVIRDRKHTMPADSYTTTLFQKGLDHIAKKVAEESAETILAAKDHSKQQIAYETADLLYHLLVLLAEEEVSLESVAEELSQRTGKKKSEYKK